MLLSLSLLGGFIAALIFYWALLQLSKIRLRDKKMLLPVSLEKILKEKAQKPKSLTYEEENISTSHISAGFKASAPDNLPIADEATLVGLKSPVVPGSKDEGEAVAEDASDISNIKEPTPEEVEKRLNKLLPKDPTPEEVKERLNKLLNGEL